MKKLLLVSALILSINAHAQNNPESIHNDSRIKQVIYQDNNVIPIYGTSFTSTEIQFGEKEVVLDIEGGDSTAWMVTYHPEIANSLFIKPTSLGSHTNLTVITNQHRYYFHLTSNKELELNPKQQTYALKFIYQNKKTTAPKDSQVKANHLHPKVLNSAYRFSGYAQLVPKHVFDDGKFTYFELSPNAPVPAVFAVDDQSGKESTVNTRREGKYLIVQRLAPQFTLREGGHATSVFNSQEIKRIAANRRPQ